MGKSLHHIMIGKFASWKERIYRNFSEFLNGSTMALNGLLTFLSISSIWIGINGFFVTYVSHILLGLTPSTEVCLIVFLVVFSTYSLNKFTDMKEDEINMPERVKFISHRKRIVLLSALSAYSLSILLTFQVNPYAIPIVVIPLITNFIYGLKLIPRIPRLKDIPIMKNVFVALSWASVVVLLPESGNISSSNEFTVVIFYFILVKCFINTVLFDIRDVEGDRAMGVETIPVILRIKKNLDHTSGHQQHSYFPGSIHSRRG